MKYKFKSNTKILLGIIVGLILGGSAIYVVATTYYSNNIVYNNTNSTLSATNVQDAIDELYTKSRGPIITSVVDNEDLTVTVGITITQNPVAYVCVNTNAKTTDDCTWKNVSGTSFTTNTVASSGAYYIHVQDTGGRITHSSSISITGNRNLFSYLNKLGTTIYTDTIAGVDYSKSAEENETNGLYLLSSTSGDEYPIYFYRGIVDNNLLFAGLCWKIIRTTEYGGL